MRIRLDAAVPAPLATTVLSQAVELPIPKPAEPAAAAKPSSNTKPTSSKAESSTKIPKWLKVGQSKFCIRYRPDIANSLLQFQEK
jgi:hypothetical protein